MNEMNNNICAGELLPQYKVNGFDPNNVLTKVQDVDAHGTVEESLIMRWKPALQWFLTVFPNGTMGFDFIVLNERKATVKARIYRDAKDTMPACEAVATRYHSDDKNGLYYEQNAVTAAYRKALSYLGFDAPMDAHDQEGLEVLTADEVPERGEKGIVITPRPPRPVVQNADADILTAESVKEAKKEKATKKTGCRTKSEKNIEDAAPVEEKPVDVVHNADQADAEPLNKPMVAPAPAPVPAAVSAAPAPAAAVSAPEKTENQNEMPETFEDAKKFIFPYGITKGKTVEESASLRGDGYIRWHRDKAAENFPGSPFETALNIYCEYKGC